jgi:hypothetical protein
MRLPIFLLMGALVGCGAAESMVGANAMKRIAGTWTLQSVNGSPLPIASSTGMETLSARFLADRNGTFSVISVVRIPTTGTQAEVATLESGRIYCGHVGCNPMLLLFNALGTSAPGAPSAGVDVDVTDTTLTMHQPGSLQVYRRE